MLFDDELHLVETHKFAEIGERELQVRVVSPVFLLLDLHLNWWIHQVHHLLIAFEARVEVNRLNLLGFQQCRLAVPR